MGRLAPVSPARLRRQCAPPRFPPKALHVLFYGGAAVVRGVALTFFWLWLLGTVAVTAIGIWIIESSECNGAAWPWDWPQKWWRE